MQEILTAYFLGFVLAFAIGPVFFVFLETSITKGFKSAMAFDLGVILADIFYIAIAFYSTNIIVANLKGNARFIVLGIGGVLMILYGGISFLRISKKIYREIVKEYKEDIVVCKKQYRQLFVKGFLLNFINVGVFFCWLGYMVIANSFATSKRDIFVFFGIVLVGYLTTDIIKIMIAKKLKKKLTPKRIFKAKKFIALLILGFGLFLIARVIFFFLK